MNAVLNNENSFEGVRLIPLEENPIIDRLGIPAEELPTYPVLRYLAEVGLSAMKSGHDKIMRGEAGSYAADEIRSGHEPFFTDSFHIRLGNATLHGVEASHPQYEEFTSHFMGGASLLRGALAASRLFAHGTVRNFDSTDHTGPTYFERTAYLPLQPNNASYPPSMVAAGITGSVRGNGLAKLQFSDVIPMMSRGCETSRTLTIKTSESLGLVEATAVVTRFDGLFSQLDQQARMYAATGTYVQLVNRAIAEHEQH